MPRSGPAAAGHQRGRGARFNEAGAIMPRSGEDEDGGGPESRRASMRPGQSCPGVVLP